jgi:hypothetical protein
MAFIAAYERITTTAREQRQLPVQVSIGWDGAQRQEALTKRFSATRSAPPAVVQSAGQRRDIARRCFQPRCWARP